MFLWHLFQSVTLFLKCDTIFKSVTLFSNCDTIFKMSHFFSKCHTIFQMSHMMNFSESVTFVTKFRVLSHFFHFILARLDWMSQIDVLYVHLSLVFSWADQRSVMLAILSTSSILGQFSVHPIGVLGLVVEQQEILMPL